MDIKKVTEKQLAELLRDKAEPSEGRMKLLKLAIAFMAVNAKLEEAEFGEFFKKDDDEKVETKKHNGGARIPAKET